MPVDDCGECLENDTDQYECFECGEEFCYDHSYLCNMCPSTACVEHYRKCNKCSQTMCEHDTSKQAYMVCKKCTGEWPIL